MHDHLIGHYPLSDCLDGQKYLMQQVMPDLLEYVPGHFICISDFSTMVHQLIFQECTKLPKCCLFNRWICCDRPVSWPPRPPDLCSFIFILWIQQKGVVYETPFASADILVSRVRSAAANVSNMPGTFKLVRNLKYRRCETCIIAASPSFELCYNYMLFVFILLLQFFIVFSITAKQAHSRGPQFAFRPHIV